MKRPCISGLACAALLLAGCAHFTPRPLAPAQTAAAFESGSLTNQDLRQFLETNGITGQWPRPEWHMRDLACVAFYYHPDLRLARAQWESAAAAIITAGQRPNPSVTVTPGYDAQIPSAPSPWIVPLSFDLPIETAGKRRYRVAQQRQLAEAAYWKWVGAIWQARGGVRAALLNLQAAGRSRVLFDEQLAAQSNVVRLLEGQVTAGAASGFDLTQARVAFDTSRLARQDAERQQIQARAQLATALGLPAAALEGARFAEDELESVPANLAEPDVRKQALLGRADVRAALAQYAASQSALQLAIAGQYPDVHLGPGYAWNNGSAGDSEWQLGLTVSLPILNHNQGGVAEAEANRREMAASFMSVQAQAIGQIDGALAGYRAALEELRVAKTLLDELGQRLKSARSMLDAGEVDPLTQANAEAEFSSGAVSRLDALVKAQQALAQLEDATQSPLTLPERVMRTVQAKNEP
ncbi:MAG TPA: TolC family protein [Verrucomicrobiae bacterium]|jgi:outer membrane protein TolC